jgi:hypothetical protein
MDNEDSGNIRFWRINWNNDKIEYDLIWIDPGIGTKL